jgi:hypothetical protein
VWLCRQRGRRARWISQTVTALVTLGALGWGLAYLSIYTAPDTRIAATDWIRQQVATGSKIVVEDKNTLVPVPDAAHPMGLYTYPVLEVTQPDTVAKMDAFADALSRGDWLTISSRRWSWVLPRLPNFPYTARYYYLLFAGNLGYTPAARFSSPPRIGLFSWPDNTAEETFQVFDHPTVLIFRNTGHLTKGQLQSLLSGP